METKNTNLKDTLLRKKKNAFEFFSAAELDAAMSYAEGYKDFLDNAKIEREAVKKAISILTAEGYVPYNFGDDVVPGGKYYYNNRGKSLYAFRMGTESILEGIRILAAHIDSPRLDLKQNPLFEENGLGYLKTHYYGGVRKYQWVTQPLALHGTVILADGSSVDITIGEEAGDPVFCITDLLPHLGREQNTKTLGTAFNGENLSILVASSPVMENGEIASEDDPVKLCVMKYLNEKYGMVEEDFISAELCAVPAGKCVDVGLDRWMLGAYGHDDVVCAYPALTALLESEGSPHTVMCILADKEETGSDGATGMQCSILCDLMDTLAASAGVSGAAVRAASKCLSADVTAGYDPLYSDVFDRMNSSYITYGVAMAKYTGGGGKSSTNDADAEFVGYLRRLFADNGVLWQTAEMGKVDAGGGGTVAKYIANLNVTTVDLGVPVLSMHAPFEIISKADLYTAHLAYKAFCL